MPVRVVYGLEVVEVYQDTRKGMFVALRPEELVSQPGVEVTVVEEPGQVVGYRLSLEPAEELLSFRDVPADGYGGLGFAVFVPNEREGYVRGEQRSVASPSVDFASPRHTVGAGFQHLSRAAVGLPRREKHRSVLAHEPMPGVAEDVFGRVVRG